LKEEIKKERLEKKLGKIQNTNGSAKILPLTLNDSDEDEDEDEDNGILVLKKKKKRSQDEIDNDQESSDALPNGDTITNKMQQQIAQPPLRKPKRIRIDALSNGENKRITFNDEGDEEGGNGLISELAIKNNNKKTNAQATVDGGANLPEPQDLADDHQQYLRRVKERLDGTKEQDLREEKDRIREKHKKKKMKDKDIKGADGDGDEDDGAVYTLPDSDSDGDDGNSGGESESEQLGRSDSDSDGESSSSSRHDSDSDSSSEDEEEDLKAQEELALALIRGEK